MRLPQFKTAGGGSRGEDVCFIKSSPLPITFDALVTGMVTTAKNSGRRREGGGRVREKNGNYPFNDNIIMILICNFVSFCYLFVGKGRCARGPRALKKRTFS